MAVLKSVHAYYSRLTTPVLQYDAKADPDLPHMNKEYTMDILIPEKTWKAFKKHYKTVKSIKNVKTLDAKEFENIYKVAPPYEAEEYFVLKMTKMAYYKNSKEATVPISVSGVVGKTKDRQGQDVGKETLIGNGSEVHVQFTERTFTYNGSKGLTLDLKAVCVLNLIPYIPEDTNEFEYEEGEEESDFEEGEASFGEESDDSDDSEDGDDDWA